MLSVCGLCPDFGFEPLRGFDCVMSGMNAEATLKNRHSLGEHRALLWISDWDYVTRLKLSNLAKSHARIADA